MKNEIVTLKRTYSVNSFKRAEEDTIILQMIMSNGECYDAWFNNGRCNVQLLIDSNGIERTFTGGNTSFYVDSTDISVVQDAIWCIANGWLEFPEDYFKGFSKNKITRAVNKNQYVWGLRSFCNDCNGTGNVPSSDNEYYVNCNVCDGDGILK